jgi:hypothetical protein
VNERRDELNESDMERCARWLQELEVNSEGVEVILHLRQQVLGLQARVRQLEEELGVRRQGHARWLTLYRETSYEATWRDSEDETK